MNLFLLRPFSLSRLSTRLFSTRFTLLSGVRVSIPREHTEVPPCNILHLYFVQKHCFIKFSSVRDRQEIPNLKY